MAIPMFQSLIGFKINWNVRSVKSVTLSGSFQSLIGFKINWNTLGLRHFEGH